MRYCLDGLEIGQEFEMIYILIGSAIAGIIGLVLFSGKEPANPHSTRMPYAVSGDESVRDHS